MQIGQSATVQEISLADLFQALRRYATVVALITGLGIAGGALISKLLPSKYGYIALMKMGQAAQVRDDGAMRILALADPAELRGYVTFLGNSSEVAIPGASLKSVEILKSQVTDAMTMLLLTAQASTLADAEAMLNRILPLVQKRYEDQVNQQRAMYTSQSQRLAVQREALQSTIELINTRITNVRDQAASLTLLLHKRSLLAELEKMNAEADVLTQAASPNVTYNFKYVDVRPVSQDPVAPQTKKIIFLAGIFGLLAGCMSAFALSFMRKTHEA